MQPTNPLSLRRNFSWTFLGNAVYAACQWGMLIVLAKLGSPEMVGQFTLGLAVSAPVFMFTNLQLRNIQATDAKRQYLFGDYLALRLIATGVALLVILGITLVSGYRREILLIILLVGLAKAFESISDVFYGFIQHHERMDKIAISLMIRGLSSLLVLSFGIYLSGAMVWGLLGLAIVWGAILIGWELRSAAVLTLNQTEHKTKQPYQNSSPWQLQPCWDLKTLRKLTWLALPLGFVMMLISLNINIPRYLIEGYLGERELGIFAALAYLMMAGNTIVFALGDSASPRLARYYASGKIKAFRTLLLKLMGIAFLLGVASISLSLVAGKQILTLVYQPEYGEYADLFVWLMVVAAFNYVSSFLGYAITAARYFRIQIPLLTLTITTSTLACLWLLPRYGLQGVVIAQILAAFVQIFTSSGVIIYALKRIDQY